MGLENLINVSISRETEAVSQAGFGTPFILGPNKTASGVGSYSSLAAVLLEPGLTSSTDEYKAAAKIFGQSPKPTLIKIGKSLSKVAQVDTITPTAVNAHHYIVTLAGLFSGVAFSLSYDYTSDGSATAAEIVTGLIALINAATASHGVVASGSSTLILTANTAGRPFTTTVSDATNMVLVHTTANVGVVESLAALELIDNDWYALISTFRSIDDVMQIAAHVEALLKIFGVSRNDAGMIDGTSVTDLAYLLKAANYFRTWVEYSGDTANFPEAALFGRCLPTTPGSETWAYKTPAGQVVDVLTDTQISALKAKNCNYFTPYGGVNITLDGKVAGGEYIDIIRLIDLLAARMQEGIFGQLVRSDKIPFTNAGITVIQNEVISVLKANQKTGGIAPDDVDANGDLVPGFSTSFPNISDISANDRAARTLSGGTWTARLAGAIQAVTINGTVTV